MADLTGSEAVRELAPTGGAKLIKVVLPNTTDTADTVDITLADYGLSRVDTVQGFVHTTEDSVIVEEAPTTVVSSGVLTITVGGTAISDKKRVYLITGE